jgi:hypothetical protein
MLIAFFGLFVGESRVKPIRSSLLMLKFVAFVGASAFGLAISGKIRAFMFTTAAVGELDRFRGDRSWNTGARD